LTGLYRGSSTRDISISLTFTFGSVQAGLGAGASERSAVKDETVLADRGSSKETLQQFQRSCNMARRSPGSTNSCTAPARMYTVPAIGYKHGDMPSTWMAAAGQGGFSSSRWTCFEAYIYTLPGLCSKECRGKSRGTIYARIQVPKFATARAPATTSCRPLSKDGSRNQAWHAFEGANRMFPHDNPRYAGEAMMPSRRVPDAANREGFIGPSVGRSRPRGGFPPAG
jgi:hypothetical protein